MARNPLQLRTCLCVCTYIIINYPELSIPLNNLASRDDGWNGMTFAHLSIDCDAQVEMNANSDEDDG